MDNWYTIAKGIPLNGHIRVTCCNSNTTALISHSSKGYRFHCFRCGDTAWKPKGDMTLMELKHLVKSVGSFQQLNGKFPDDACKDFPDAERIWLAEGGVTRPGVEGVGYDNYISYSPSMQRVLLPVYTHWDNDPDFSEPGGYQARSCRVKPKYITSGHAPYHVSARNYMCRGHCLCITEDILSCNKVGRYVPAMALMGTHLTDAAIGAIINYPRALETIYVWLDPDEAGQAASEKIAERLRVMGIAKDIVQLVSENDPKKTPRDEIRRIFA